MSFACRTAASAVLPFILLALGSGCNGHSESQTIPTSIRHRTSDREDWNALFDSSSKTENAVRKLGLGELDYKIFPSPPPSYFGNVSAEISDTGDGLPNSLHIDVYGRDSETLDEIDFTLGIYNPSFVSDSRSKFEAVIAKFLSDNRLSGLAAVRSSLPDAKPAETSVGNAVLSIRRNDHNRPSSGKFDLEFIFHRPDVAIQAD